MATLKHEESGERHPVPARMLVGRAASCALRLNDKHVSGEHATVVWTGGAWVVRDLGSRNGTFVDGKRLEPGSPATVAAGARIGFGRTEGFELVDAGAPAALAESASGALVVANDGILALPSAEQPEVVVYADARGAWVAERGEEVGPIKDGEAIVAGGSAWTIRVPASIEGTATVDAGPTLDTVKLKFAVSLDEEHVEISVLHRGKETKLEAREHGYILLTLARARQADGEMPLPEQGWLDRDRLVKMLGVDSNALNVGIYRARGQLGRAGVEGAAGIVEVRRGHRRFGMEPDRFEITSLG